MLTRILFFVFYLLSTLHTISQDERGIPIITKDHYWSISYLAGAVYDTDGDLGYKFGIETSYREDEIKEFFLNFSVSKIHDSEITENNLVECSIGPRVYLPVRDAYLEGNIGAQIFTRTSKYDYWDYGYSWYYSKVRASFYFSGGAGYNFTLSRTNTLHFRIKYSTTMPPSEGLSYVSVQTGINFNTLKVSKTISPVKNKNRPISISAGAGLNSATGLYDNIYSGKSMYMIESSIPVSAKTEFFIESNFSTFTINERVKVNKLLSINFGPRLFINENPFTAFFEFGGGLHILLNKEENSRYDHIQPGLNAGTGIIAKILGPASLFVKGKLHLIFTENEAFPPYSSFAGGLRFNL